MLDKEDEHVVYDIQYDIQYDNSDDYSSSSCDPSASQSKFSKNATRQKLDKKSSAKSKPFAEAYRDDFELAFPVSQKKKAFSGENYIRQKFEINQFEELNDMLDNNMQQQYESDISAGSDEEQNMMNHESLQHITLNIQETYKIPSNPAGRGYDIGFEVESEQSYEYNEPTTNQIGMNRKVNEETKNYSKNESYSDSDSHSFKDDYSKPYASKAKSWDKASRNNSSMRKHLHTN